ncbi:MAG: hypothetical protein R2774_11580 [Saprospiraceae bacterium]
MRSVFLAFVTVLGLSLISCKSDTKSGSEPTGNATENVSQTAAPAITAAEKFDSKILAEKGGQDISKTFTLKQDQFLPEYDNGFSFKSKQALDIYAKGSSDNIDFSANEAIGVFMSKTNKETIFKVESVNFDGAEGPEIHITTTTTDKEVAPYRPSFIMAIPKDKIKGYPMIMVNSNLVPVTTVQ